MAEIERLQSEKARRLDAVRRAMGEQGLDALIVYGSTGVGIAMAGNYPYLSRHVPMYAASLMLIPRDGEPAIFVPGENQHLEARRTSWIDDVRLSPAPALDLCAHAASLGRSIGTVGVSSLAAMPSAMAEALRAGLGGATLVEAAGAIFECRAVKSAHEQNILRRCTEIADTGLRRSIEILRPGLTELQWKAEMERVMTAEGADGGFNMIAAGRPGTGPDAFHGFVISPTARTFRDGDLALLEISPRLEGYYSQIVRLISLGPVPSEMARAHAACIEARRAALDSLVPGTSFAAIAEIMHDALKERGYVMKDVGSAHTIGLDLSESIINTTGAGVLAEGMVVTLHPMIALDRARQLFVGDTIAIGTAGPVTLGEVRDEIVVLDGRTPQ